MVRYDSYKDSGVEWINEIPSNWEKSRIRMVGDLYGGLTGKKGSDFNDEDNPSNKPFVPFTNIFNNTYISKDHFQYVNVEETENQNRVLKNDLFFLMSSESYEDLGKCSILLDDVEELYLNSFCKGFRIKDSKVYPLFLNYQLLGSLHKEMISVEGNGFTRINLRQDRLLDIPVFIPPLSEQQQIVSFLDTKTSLIDSLIEKTQQKIELLKEKRTSLINEVVTKGLNPNVEMKESSVEWIGKIPSHWKRTPLKYNSYMKGRIGWKGLKQDEFLDKGNYYLITGHDIKNDKMNWENCYHISKERYEESPEIMLQEGDLLFTKDGTIGKTLYIESLPKPTSLNSHLLVIRPLNKFYDSKFLQYMFKTSQFLMYVEHNKTGTTFYGMSQNSMENFKGYFPPLSEQQQIVEYLDEQTQLIDKTISIEEKRIELLKEYRQSLISEVVTGKRKVVE